MTEGTEAVVGMRAEVPPEMLAALAAPGMPAPGREVTLPEVAQGTPVREDVPDRMPGAQVLEVAPEPMAQTPAPKAMVGVAQELSAVDVVPGRAARAMALERALDVVPEATPGMV